VRITVSRDLLPAVCVGVLSFVFSLSFFVLFLIFLFFFFSLLLLCLDMCFASVEDVTSSYISGQACSTAFVDIPMKDDSCIF